MSCSSAGTRCSKYLSYLGKALVTWFWAASGCIWESAFSTLHRLCKRCHWCPPCASEVASALLLIMLLQSWLLPPGSPGYKQLCCFWCHLSHGPPVALHGLSTGLSATATCTTALLLLGPGGPGSAVVRCTVFTGVTATARGLGSCVHSLLLVGPVSGALSLGAGSLALLCFLKPQVLGANHHCYGRGRGWAASAVAAPVASGLWLPGCFSKPQVRGTHCCCQGYLHLGCCSHCWKGRCQRHCHWGRGKGLGHRCLMVPRVSVHEPTVIPAASGSMGCMNSWGLHVWALPQFLGPLFTSAATDLGTFGLRNCRCCSPGSTASRRSSPPIFRCIDTEIAGVLVCCAESFVGQWMSYWL